MMALHNIEEVESDSSVQALGGIELSKDLDNKMVMVEARCDSTAGCIFCNPASSHSNKTTKVKLAKENIQKMEIYNE